MTATPDWRSNPHPWDGPPACTTHHACDCHLWRHDMMVDALQTIYCWCDFQGGVEADPDEIVKLCRKALRGEE
jgi:hypothetical protein